MWLFTLSVCLFVRLSPSFQLNDDQNKVLKQLLQLWLGPRPRNGRKTSGNIFRVCIVYQLSKLVQHKSRPKAHFHWKKILHERGSGGHWTRPWLQETIANSSIDPLAKFGGARSVEEYNVFIFKPGSWLSPLVLGPGLSPILPTPSVRLGWMALYHIPQYKNRHKCAQQAEHLGKWQLENLKIEEKKFTITIHYSQVNVRYSDISVHSPYFGGLLPPEPR